MSRLTCVYFKFKCKLNPVISLTIFLYRIQLHNLPCISTSKMLAFCPQWTSVAIWFALSAENLSFASNY